MVYTTRSWWMTLIRGIAAVLFGILALVLTGLTLRLLIALFGAYVLIDGIMAVAAAVRAIERHRHSGWLLLEGILGILAGLIAFFLPGLTALVLLYIIAAWAILTGVTEVVQAVELRRVIHNEWLLIVDGALSLVFGIVLVLFPGVGALAVVWLIGIYAILIGGALIGLSLRFRNLPRQMLTPAL